MTSDNHRFPKDWPSHLQSNASVSPDNSVPPTEQILLDIASMKPETFEQFCWWLLKKDESLVGCQRLGGNGHAQDGIDLFASSKLHENKFEVFECKASEKYTPDKLKKAINAFLHGIWASKTAKFTLILAQQETTPPLANVWTEQALHLRKAGIEAELWTAHELTLKVQPYPDILTKFFGSYRIDGFANIWMERVAFHELVSRSLFDPREDVAKWARKMSAGSGTEKSESSQGKNQKNLVIDGEYRKESSAGNGWQYSGPWFSISLILPGGHFTHASAAINFNRPDMQGMTLTVDHKWLLHKFAFRVGAPLTGKNRAYLIQHSEKEQKKCVIDFPNCRMFLEKEGAEELAFASDLLTDRIREALLSIEKNWAAYDFPFISSTGQKVALCAIHKDVWREIGRFAVDHDNERGSTDWHMFDGNPNVLKPYNPKHSQRYDAGYHGIFYASEIEGLSFKDEVVLLWEPDSLNPDKELSSRGWWSCEYAYHWLTEQLLPAVKKRMWDEECSGHLRRALNPKRTKAIASWLDEKFVVRNLREPPLIRDGNWTVGIRECMEELQVFFHSIQGNEPYLVQNDVEELYKICAAMAQGNRGYLGYISSKLDLGNTPENHTSLAELIDRHLREERIVSNCGVADHTFRAMLELIGGEDNWLPQSLQIRIRQALTPFAQIRDDAILVHRHTHWS